MKKSDFGDILDKWENSACHTKKKAINEWLENNDMFDKDTIKDNDYAPGEKRRKLLNKKPDDTLDIHGLNRERAWLFLEQFFTNAKNNNYQKLRIIHGKGNHTGESSILGVTVRTYIEKCHFAGESGFEKSANGGSGATWVLLKD